MVYKRGKIWWYEFYFDGARIRESTKSSKKKLAEEAERSRKGQLERSVNGLVQRERPKTFTVLADEYLSIKRPCLAPRSYQIEMANLRHLLPFFGRMLIVDIKPRDIADYQQSRLQQEASPKTVNLEFGTLRAILRRAKVWSAIQQDVRLLPVEDTVGRAISVLEEQKLLRACLQSRSRSLYPAVVLALTSGMRDSDVRLLRWSQIDFERRQVTVGKSKTQYSTGRVLPLGAFALSVIEGWARQFPNRQPEHYVFPTERYGAAGDGFTACAYAIDPTKPIGSLKTAWKNAKEAAGVQCRFHDLRHTACTRMLEGGAPLTVVTAIMGWSPATAIRMSRRYGHIGQTAQRQAIEMISSLPSPAQPETVN